MLGVAGLGWYKQRRDAAAQLQAIEGRVYRIGADHAPPYYWHQPDGRIEGLAVDVMNEAARQAGLRLAWVPVTGQPTEALRQKKVDFWPALNPSIVGREALHFSKPWIENHFVAVRIGRAAERHIPVDPESSDDIVGVRNSSTSIQKAMRAFPGARIRAYPYREDALLGLCRGEVSVAAFEARFLDAALQDRPPPCEGKPFAVQMLRGQQSKLSITSRPEDAMAADLLREGLNRAADAGLFGQAMDKWSALSSSESRTLFALEEAERQKQSLQTRLSWGRLLVFSLVLLSWLAYRASRRARAAQRAAERAAQAKSDFLANVSHEIRTPLNGVIGMANLLLEREWDESKRADVRTLQESAQSLLSVLNDVLDFSKLEAGRVSLALAPFDPRALLTQVRDLFQSLARQRNLDLQLELPENLPPGLAGDASRIQQIVMNFTGNALKFTEAGTVRIFAEVLHRDEWQVGLRIGVQDTGIGIPAEVRRRLFEKFEQGDTSTSRRYGGTGLGLAISKRLAELMGGQVGLTSEVGAGSTFWVDLQLPLAAMPSRSGSNGARARKHYVGRVLVAEDNVVNRQLVTRMLAQFGLEPRLAEDGQRALACLREERFDLVLMDCQMPVMDGYEATREWRKLEREMDREPQRVPVVAITAHAFAEDSARCREAGMNEYLSKPLEIHALEAVLAKYLEEKQESSPEINSTLTAQ